MDDLPTTTANQPQPLSHMGSMAKETVPVTEIAEISVVPESGKEAELSSEVKKAGVTIQADTIELPRPVVSMGVTAVPQPIVAQVAIVSLPLTDDQIAQGLHQSLLSSWRWLAEWCDRQLKRAHILLTTVQGKAVRKKE